MSGWDAAAISACASSTRVIGHSMFDCPEQIHTSPTITFSSTTFVRPLTVIVYGPPAAGVRRATLQRPSSSARVVAASPAQSATTRTSTPGSSHPHSATSRCCWSTMPSADDRGEPDVTARGAAQGQRQNDHPPPRPTRISACHDGQCSDPISGAHLSDTGSVCTGRGNPATRSPAQSDPRGVDTSSRGAARPASVRTCRQLGGILMFGVRNVVLGAAVLSMAGLVGCGSTLSQRMARSGESQSEAYHLWWDQEVIWHKQANVFYSPHSEGVLLVRRRRLAAGSGAARWLRDPWQRQEGRAPLAHPEGVHE